MSASEAKWRCMWAIGSILLNRGLRLVLILMLIPADRG